MERWRFRVFGPVLLVTTMGFGGCHDMWVLDTPGNLEFMKLWNTYSHCRTSADPNEMHRDAEQLFRAAQIITQKSSSSVLAFPINELPVRLTVDPQAMAIACTLYGGQAAQSLGRLALASEMFNSVVTATTKADYAFYVDEASRGMRKLEAAPAFQKRTDLAHIAGEKLRIEHK